MLLLRNIAFYLAFYLISPFYVIAALAVMPFDRQAFRTAVRRWGKFHRWCVNRLLGIRVVIEGEQGDSTVLHAIRHESFFEAIDCPALFDYPAVFAKAELFRIPGWGRVARRYGLVPVAREQGAKTLRMMIKSARQLSNEGRELVLFPEGTRVPHGRVAPLGAGFAGIYKLIGLPVVPVAVNSGPLYHRAWKRPGTITYRYGKVIPPGLPRAEIEARVTEAINALNA